MNSNPTSNMRSTSVPKSKFTTTAVNLFKKPIIPFNHANGKVGLRKDVIPL